MVNEDILGGLKAALVRKQSLRQAMISLLNAGYEKTEIKEAAISLQREKHTVPQIVIPKKVVPAKPKSKTKKFNLFSGKKISKPEKPKKINEKPPQIKKPLKISKPALTKEEKERIRLEEIKKQQELKKRLDKITKRTLKISIILLTLLAVLMIMGSSYFGFEKLISEIKSLLGIAS